MKLHAAMMLALIPFAGSTDVCAQGATRVRRRLGSMGSSELDVRLCRKRNDSRSIYCLTCAKPIFGEI